MSSVANDSESPKKDTHPEIKVKDRRRFTAEGDPIELPSDQEVSNEDLPADSEALPAEPTPVSETAHAETSSGAQPLPGDPDNTSSPDVHTLPPASFEMLILSLGMQAQMELGKGAAQPESTPNLEIAQHTIDLLSVLQEKTKGNLSLEEQRLLDNTLTELRFRYVQALGDINAAASRPSP